MLNGLEINRMKVRELPLSPGKLVSRVSEFCMLKIGDLIYCGSPFRQKDLKIGDRLSMCLDGRILLDFYLK